jgi:adenosylmethionine-8-amino-7-oxononanoate aminotransferase
MSHVFPRVLGRDLPMVERAQGAIVWDSDGKQYLDAAGGAIVVGVGHGDQRVVAALADQARRVAYAHGTQFTSAALESYTEEVASLLPLEDPRLYPVSGGSEAVETALKMVRAYHLAMGHPERTKVVARGGSYHGNTLGALDASGRAQLRRPYEAWLGRSLHVPAVYEYRCSLETHDVECGARHAEILEEAIEREGPDTVACFIAEPIVGAALGAAVPPPDYWGPVKKVCERHGVLLVADEVMTGFGRTGRWFGSDHWDLRPDLLAAGKGASSGYWPFGFAACSGRVFEAISTTGFTHGFTYSHSVMGCAVAHAVLKQLRDKGLVEASRDKGEMLRARLQDVLGDHPQVGDIRGLGLMIGVELVAERASRKPAPRGAMVTEKVLAAARERGVLLYPSTGGADETDGDTLMLGPPFVISEDQVDQAVEGVSGALGEVLGRRP